MKRLLRHIRDVFNPPATEMQAAAAAELKALGIYNYTVRPDGTVYVRGTICLNNKMLHRLPDLSCVVLGGDFFCENNYLKSLKGSPREVGGSFSCINNLLENLEHMPQKIKHGFYGDNNNLITLKGASQEIGGIFSCLGNKLSVLEHAPRNSGALHSDFGVFPSWQEVPDYLQKSDETRQDEQRARAEAIRRNTATQGRIRLMTRIGAS